MDNLTARVGAEVFQRVASWSAYKTRIFKTGLRKDVVSVCAVSTSPNATL